MDYVNTNLDRHYQPDQSYAFWSGDWQRHTLAGVATPEEQAEVDEFARRVGSAIQAARLERDVSQEALAEAAGTSTTTMGRWERGKNAPKSFQLAKLWKYLNDIKPWTAGDLFDPPDDLSELQRRQLERAVAEGQAAAWRPRRRATRKGGDAPAARPARRPKKGPPGSTRG